MEDESRHRSGGKKRLRSLIEGESRSESAVGLGIGETERLSFSFDHRWMMDDKLFYADHFVLLPTWVQVVLHDCDHEELMELARKLRDAGRH